MKIEKEVAKINPNPEFFKPKIKFNGKYYKKRLKEIRKYFGTAGR